MTPFNSNSRLDPISSPTLMYLNQLTMWMISDFIMLINIMRENIMFCDGEKEIETLNKEYKSKGR